MHQALGIAVRPMIRLLTVAMFLPCITGFDNVESKPGAVNAPGTITIPASQSPPPTAPEATGDSFNWRRNRDLEPGAADSVDPGTVMAEEGTAPKKVHSWETGANKSYLIPALEVPGFLGLLNGYDRIFHANDTQDGKKVYSSTFSSTWEHLSKQNWVFDKDPFNINQFAHPYQGATMYGLARSSGLGFWGSLAYSNVGSFLWKMAGETDPPSINDQITTGNAGSLLGEALFRMAGLVLEDGGDKPDGWHELGAAIVSPTTAVNRLVFGHA